MKTILASFMLLMSFAIYAQAYEPVGPGNRKIRRINNIEEYLVENNKRNEAIDKVLLAHKKDIDELQQKISELVAKQLALDAVEKQEKDKQANGDYVPSNKEVIERLGDVENKIVSLQDKEIKDLQNQVQQMANTIKSLEVIIQTLEVKMNKITK